LSRKVTAFWKKCQEKVGEEIYFIKKRKVQARYLPAP
jgi:hypothetical protein